MKDLKLSSKVILEFWTDIILHTVRFLFGAVFAIGYLKDVKSEMIVSGLMIFFICIYLRRQKICEDNYILGHIDTLYKCVKVMQKIPRDGDLDD